MYPMWIMGLLMLFGTYKSKYKDLLRVDKASLVKWVHFLGTISMYRIVMFYFLKDWHVLKHATDGAMMIPWQATLTVFWEDACHGLPLVLLALSTATYKHAKWLNRIAMATVMISFGAGHLYQGWLAAVGLSMYIPFSMEIGKKNGFGTVMIGHMMYDFITIITMKAVLG